MNKIIVVIVVLLLPQIHKAQSKFTINGFIEDANTHERLIGANLIAGENQGVATNQFGFYSMTLPIGNYQLITRYVGYKTAITNVELEGDTALNISLEIGLELDEIEVTAKRINENNPQLSGLNFVKLDLKQIDKAPIVFGERDILKTLQFLPGIKSGRENTAGFNVRGGSSDQNLIMLDGVPVYNVNHLFGFFSVFNSDAIKNVNLYKGGIPARYGGRLSSVLDITMKEGNMREAHGVFSISPISARITYEAPIKKDTAAFIVSLRRTMIDIPMLLYQSVIAQKNKYSYFFYDFNAKANWIINQKNRIYLSVYTGQDKQFNNSKSDGIKSKFRYNWGNITSVFRWNQTISPRLFSNISAYYSKYNLSNIGQSTSDDLKIIFQSESELQDLCLKTDYDFYVSPVYTFRFGGKASRMFFKPNIIQMIGEGTDTTLNTDQKNRSNNFETFLENDIKYGRFNMNIGARGTANQTGVKTYWNIEPRAAVRFQAANYFSVNVAYTRMTQFIHLLSNSSLGMPAELWVASTDKVKPQKSSQFSAGIEKIFPDYSFGIEGYYKKMNDVIRFKEGVAFLSTQDAKWDENISVGQGEAYGIEFMAKKTQGKVTGMFSYTLSWSNRQFDDINNGEWFPYKYDRIHDFSVLGEYLLLNTGYQERSFSFGFTLQSGNNISMPDTEYEGKYLPGMEGTTFAPEDLELRQSYEYPNNFKMPLFHHLDFGYNTIRKKTDGKTYTWSFSVYNIYNRMNPWYYYKTATGKVKQVSMFPIIPSVGFKYVF